MSRSVYSVVKYYCFRRGLHDYERLTKFMRFGGMHTMAFPNALEAFVLGLCVVLYLSNSSFFFLTVCNPCLFVIRPISLLKLCFCYHVLFR